jgi:hypothetical protein
MPSKCKFSPYGKGKIVNPPPPLFFSCRQSKLKLYTLVQMYKCQRALLFKGIQLYGQKINNFRQKEEPLLIFEFSNCSSDEMYSLPFPTQ